MAIFPARSFSWWPSNLSVFAAAALLAGCAGAAQPAGGLPGAASATARHAASGDLVYLSDVKTNQVGVYTYPQGKRVGTITTLGRPRSECADPHGNVWVADVQGDDVAQFAHGATSPSVAIDTSGAPQGCAVNPKNGDVAVTGGVGGIVLSIYHESKRGVWRDPRTFTDAQMKSVRYCSYDAQGNLFMDGTSASGGFALAELPKGAGALQSVSVSQAIAAPGQVQWDGNYLAVGDAAANASVVYQFSISGSTATLAGTTTLNGSQNVRQFWIAGSTVVAPQYGGAVRFYQYPGGGNATKVLSSVAGDGAAVSLAK